MGKGLFNFFLINKLTFLPLQLNSTQLNSFFCSVPLDLPHTTHTPIIFIHFLSLIIIINRYQQYQIPCDVKRLINMLEVPYRIPWLIWIQLIVLLLLLALLFFFTLDFSLDPDAGATVTVISPATASTSAKVFLFDEIEQIDKPVITTNHIITNSQRFTQVSQINYFSFLIINNSLYTKKSKYFPVVSETEAYPILSSVRVFNARFQVKK